MNKCIIENINVILIVHANTYTFICKSKCGPHTTTIIINFTMMKTISDSSTIIEANKINRMKTMIEVELSLYRTKIHTMNNPNSDTRHIEIIMKSFVIIIC